MDSSRRDVLRTTSSAAAGVALAGYLNPLDRLAAQTIPAPARSAGDPYLRELTHVALDAASSVITRDEVARVARAAARQAKANSLVQSLPVVLAPVAPTPNGEWRSPIQVDPFTVPLTDKVALMLDANAAALAVKGVKYADSSMRFLREERTLATSDGTFVTQTVFQSAVGLNVTAIAADGTDFQSRDSARDRADGAEKGASLHGWTQPVFLAPLVVRADSGRALSGCTATI